MIYTQHLTFSGKLATKANLWPSAEDTRAISVSVGGKGGVRRSLVGGIVFIKTTSVSLLRLLKSLRKSLRFCRMN